MTKRGLSKRNGAVVRKALGEQRFEGTGAVQCLARLYTALRYFVNFFQTSFKLAEKARDGSTVHRRYLAPATPCERLLEHSAIPTATKVRLREVAEMLDPIRLLEEVRAAQTQLETVSRGGSVSAPRSGEPDLVRFLANLSMAVCDEETSATRSPVGLVAPAAVSVSGPNLKPTMTNAKVESPSADPAASTPSKPSLPLPPDIVRR